MARDSYLSNSLFTHFATLQQLSTVNDTLKRAIHGGLSFLSTHGYLRARDGSGTTGRGFFTKFNAGELQEQLMRQY